MDQTMKIFYHKSASKSFQEEFSCLQENNE